MNRLKVVNWKKWQPPLRNKDAAPPWIKIHRRLLSSPGWVELTDAEKGQIVSIWIIAAERHGEIPANPVSLQKVCQLDDIPNIQKFIALDFLSPMDGEELINLHKSEQELCNPHQSYEQIVDNLSTDGSTRGEERRGEDIKPFVQKKDFALQRLKFEKIWQTYPAKKGKEKAWIKFKNQVKTEQDFEDIQKALQNYIADVENIQATKQPDLQFQNGATWFHQNWKDYIEIQEPETWAEKMKRQKKEKSK